MTRKAKDKAEPKSELYINELMAALRDGATYSDLLQMKPEDYGLPKTWTGHIAKDQYTAILWAISFEFMVHETAMTWSLPSLRSIAKEVGAPYSVLMDCYEITNKQYK